MLTSITLDGFSLIGPDPLGGTWRTTSLVGWHDSPDMRRDRQQRRQQDGAWESTGFRAGRDITISGVATFTDPVAAKTAADTLRGIIGGGRGALTVVDSAGERNALVEIDGRTAISFPHELMFSWSVPLYANDPVKYGAGSFATTDLVPMAGTGWAWPAAFPVDWGIPPGTTPGAVTLANSGTAAYWPRLRFDGPVTNPIAQLVETGAWVRFEGVLAANQWLDWVLADRRVLLNGQVSRRHVVTSSGDWLAVPPGGASVTWTADDADPAAKLSVWGYSGAWI